MLFCKHCCIYYLLFTACFYVTISIQFHQFSFVNGRPDLLTFSWSVQPVPTISLLLSLLTTSTFTLPFWTNNAARLPPRLQLLASSQPFNRVCWVVCLFCGKNAGLTWGGGFSQSSSGGRTDLLTDRRTDTLGLLLLCSQLSTPLHSCPGRARRPAAPSAPANTICLIWKQAHNQRAFPNI